LEDRIPSTVNGNMTQEIHLICHAVPGASAGCRFDLQNQELSRIGGQFESQHLE
jgi:hypothetical protein